MADDNGLSRKFPFLNCITMRQYGTKAGRWGTAASGVSDFT
jgi:hypothetical protein